MGPNMSRLLTHYWERQRIVPRAWKFMGEALGTKRGVTQGDHASPMTFNIMVGAVVSEVLEEFCGPQDS